MLVTSDLTREELAARFDLSVCFNANDNLPAWPSFILFVNARIVEATT
jgi:hypothetical protein